MSDAPRAAGAVADAAVAVWVKTPGRSPVKTRLAATVGRARAEAFYRLAVRAVDGVVRAAVDTLGGTLVPYWAVAEPEPEAAAEWRGFATVGQGAGGLGERQALVYDVLQRRHGCVLFVGTDSPQLDPALLVEAARCLTPGGGGVGADGGGASFAVGPAEDGGYYLFGGRRPLPRRVWTEVPYSDPGTLAALRPRLAAYGAVATLPTLFDVDTEAELARLGGALAARGDALLAGQRALLDWLARPIA